MRSVCYFATVVLSLLAHNYGFMVLKHASNVKCILLIWYFRKWYYHVLVIHEQDEG